MQTLTQCSGNPRVVTIVDSGGANIASIRYAFERLGASITLSRDPKIIQQATHVILPGVGTARDAMSRLQAQDLIGTLRTLTQPVLGICLGMQLLFEHSEEGHVDTLNILKGHVLQIPAGDLTVPHTGWNQLHWQTPHLLAEGIPDGSYVYYTHGFYAPVSQEALAFSDYGVKLSGIVAKDNFFGMQFHPERSGSVGAQLLRNFLRL